MGLDRLETQLDKERRDLRILVAVIEHGPVEIDRLAELVDVPEYEVRYSIRMLEDDGLVEPSPDGTVAVDDIAARIDAHNAGIEAVEDRIADLRGLYESADGTDGGQSADDADADESGDGS